MAPAILTSDSQLLFNIASAGTIMPLALGLIGLVNPANGFKTFGFGEPLAPEAKKLGTNLMLFWVSRDLYMAATALTTWYLNERKALGAMYVAGCGVVCTISERDVSSRMS